MDPHSLPLLSEPPEAKHVKRLSWIEIQTQTESVWDFPLACRFLEERKTCFMCTFLVWCASPHWHSDTIKLVLSARESLFWKRLREFWSGPPPHPQHFGKNVLWAMPFSTFPSAWCSHVRHFVEGMERKRKRTEWETLKQMKTWQFYCNLFLRNWFDGGPLYGQLEDDRLFLATRAFAFRLRESHFSLRVSSCGDFINSLNYPNGFEDYSKWNAKPLVCRTQAKWRRRLWGHRLKSRLKAKA